MKIAYYGFRDWAIDIFKLTQDCEKYLISHEDYECLHGIKPDLVFFIGWSNIIPSEIIHEYTCICLHPSPLPKYRGGSPIQHQIINGETESAVSLFIMDEGVDTGDILEQRFFSLEGSLDQIFGRIVKEGAIAINGIIHNYKSNNTKASKQDQEKSTFYKRRKPHESEITLEEILSKEPEYLYNKIRALADPYPNAYVKCKNGKKLFILESKYMKNERS